MRYQNRLVEPDVERQPSMPLFDADRSRLQCVDTAVCDDDLTGSVVMLGGEVLVYVQTTDANEDRTLVAEDPIGTVFAREFHVADLIAHGVLAIGPHGHFGSAFASNTIASTGSFRPG